MNINESHLAELKKEVNPDVRVYEEGGHTYVYIPGLKLPSGCKPKVTDALLCPHPHSGYTSRLFLKEKIQTPKQVNWNGQVCVLGHQWYAFSYNNVGEGPFLNMVMNHLRGMTA